MNNQHQNYPIAPERRAEILRSLREHGLTTVDGVLCWIDNPTGEVIPVDLDYFWTIGIDLRWHIDPTTVEHAEASTRQTLEKIAAWCKQKELNEKIRDDSRGKFVFLEINRKSPKINIADINYATLSRLCALSAYIEYNKKAKKKTEKDTDILEAAAEDIVETAKTEQPADKNTKKAKKKNIIMRSSYRSHTRATEKDIRRILGLPTKTWRRFWNTCKEHGYITGDDDEGYQLISIFTYGKLDRKKSTKIQKLYIDAFMRLYRSGRIATPAKMVKGERIPTKISEIKISDHRLIGALIYLATNHMCPGTNEIVANPDEPDVYQLKPLDETGIAAALGYKTDAGHAMREINKLRDLTFRLSDDGPDLYCLARVEAGCGRGNVRYIINPALIYAGDRANYNPMMQGLHWFVENNRRDQDAV